MADSTKTSTPESGVSGVSVMSSTPTDSGVSNAPVAAMETFINSDGSRIEIPNDLVPLAAKTIILTKVNSDGTLGDYVRMFKQLLISANVTVPTESEELDTGDGANIEMSLSEVYNMEVVVNAFSPLFDAAVTGKDLTVGEAKVREMTYLTIAQTGTDPDFKYTYTFPVGKEPVERNAGKGDYEIQIFDSKGYAFTEITDKAAILTAQQYRYDATTKTVEVSVDYNNENLDVFYYMTRSDVITAKSSDTISRPVYVVEVYADYQSVNFKTTYRRTQRISRASVTGDLTEAAVQKAPNTNMSYTFASQGAATGENVYQYSMYKLD